MVIQRHLGGGKARRLLENDRKSRMINQELVLLKIDGFLTPEQAGALRENANLKDRVITMQKDNKDQLRAVVS